MSLKASLRNGPVIYEIVPPRRDTSRFNTELRGVEDVLKDGRIAAINIPELVKRVEGKDGDLYYSPVTIPPEEYALMIRERKEAVVNIVAPRMKRAEFLDRARKVVHEFGIPNLVIVGKERQADRLPGPGVLDALQMVRAEGGDRIALGGICIFDRTTSRSVDYGKGDGDDDGRLSEARRVWLKARGGCDFVTSQITFDPEPSLRFLSSYQRLCLETGEKPLTVFISLTTVPSQSILSLLDDLDVVVPARVRKRLLNSEEMGRESLRIATEVFEEIVAGVEGEDLEVPLALQIDQIGVRNDELSLRLLDNTHPILRKAW